MYLIPKKELITKGRVRVRGDGAYGRRGDERRSECVRNSARTSWGLTLACLAHVVIRMELMERGIRNWNGRKKKAWGKSSGIGNGGRGEGGVRKEARNRTAEGKCGVQRDACDNTEERTGGARMRSGRFL